MTRTSPLCDAETRRRTRARATAHALWNFGDGTAETHPISARFTHVFPGPGVYQVTASVTDNLGNTYSWTQPVLIDPPLTAAVAQDPGG